jgi:nicotinate dehydrogenase subunit B
MNQITKLGGPSRRALLKTGGALVVSIGAAVPFDFVCAAEEPVAGVQPALTPDRLSSYIAVNADGTVSAFFGKIDMGQGVAVAIAQMVAEELDVPFKTVNVVMGDTATSVNQGGASGATGVQNGGKQLRVAAAEARRILIDLAAEKLGVPAERLSVNGGIVHTGTEMAKSVSYGELIGGRYFNVTLAWNGKIGNPLYAPGKARPKDPKDYKIVGQPIKREDVAPRVFAQFNFCTDVKVPGMVHGRMIRPAVAGAMPVSVDESSIKDIPGARVVWNQGFLGVVADKEWDAIKAAQQLKVTWSNAAPPFPDQASLYDHIRKAPMTRSKARPVSSRPSTNGRFSPMPAWVLPARSWRLKTIRSPCGPVRKSRISPVTASPAYSACRRRRCAPSGFPGRARMAVTTRAMRQWMPRYWQKQSAGRSGCNTCAIRRPDGIRKRRLRSIARAPRSMPPAK